MTMLDRAANAALVFLALAVAVAVVWGLIRRHPDEDLLVDVASLPPLQRPPVGSNRTVHRQGETWHDCPPPPRRHSCWPQSGGWHHIRLDEWYERCPCGAERYNEGPWTSRNSYRTRRADPVVLPW